MINKKNSLDMINGPIWNKLPLYAFPVAATAILEQLFNASDIAVVGNFTGSGKTVAVAAVGANTSIIALLVNFFIGISVGVNVVISNAIGRQDDETVKKSVHSSVKFSFLCGFVVLIVGELVASPILSLVKVPEDVFPYALLYLRIYLIGLPVIFLYNFVAAIFRSIGDTRTPLFALFFSGVLNVFLNLFFVAVLKMTVDGVATATVISNLISSAILIYRLLKTETIIHLDFKYLKIDKVVINRIMKIGLPAGIQSAVFSISNIVIQSAINSLGTVVMAASSAAYNIEIIAYDVLNSFSQACTTFVGQNYGAGKIDRCKKTLLLSLIEDAIASFITIVAILFFGRRLLSIFNNDSSVISLGYTRLIIVFFAYIFSMLYEVLSGYLRGFGISFVPALLTTLGVCGVRILWINIAFPVKHDFSTIMLSYPISLSFTALLIFLCLIIYRPSKRFTPSITNQK